MSYFVTIISFKSIQNGGSLWIMFNKVNYKTWNCEEVIDIYRRTYEIYLGHKRTSLEKGINDIKGN